MYMQQNTILKKIVTVVCGLCLLQCACFSQNSRVIINNAKSNYHIVVSSQATPVEKDAADVLQRYLLAVSGCKLPVLNEAKNTNAKQLIIGGDGVLSSSDINDLSEDGVVIKSINSSIVFGGGNRKGVLYSVYTFLDSMLNCKMYAYDVIQTPKQTTIALPANINIKQSPAFNYRMGGFDNLTKAYCDFNKQNYLYEDWGLWVHSFEVLMPPKTYFATHPEYFSLVNGKRTPAQLCLSNPELVKILSDNLYKKMQEKPGAKFWSVSQNDNQQYCQCAACKKLDDEQGSHQGSILNFVNQVAKNFPRKTISTLAYQYSEKPPKSLRPAANVSIMLCNVNGDRSKPITAGADNNFDNNLRGWQLLTNNIFVWEYVVQFSHALSPFPNLHIIQPNIQYFKEQKIQYLFEEGFVNRPSEFSELRTYLVSKLMWNEDANVKALIHNFIQVYYGKSSAPYIENYINLLYSNSIKSGAKLYIFGNPSGQRNTYLTLNNIPDYKALFQKALSGLPANNVYYKRVIKEYLAVLYARLDVEQALMKADNNKAGINKATVKKHLDEFFKLAKAANINYINESRRSVDDYYKTVTQSLQ